MGVELELIKDMICFRLLSGVGSFLSLCCGVLDFEVLMQSALTSMPWEGSEGTDNPLNVVVPGCHPLTLCWDAWDSSPQLFAHCSGTTHVIDLVLYNPYLWVEAHLKKKKISSKCYETLWKCEPEPLQGALTPSSALQCPQTSCFLPPSRSPICKYIHIWASWLSSFFCFVYIYLSQLYSFLLMARLKLLKTSCWLSEPLFLIQIHLFAWSFIRLFNKRIREYSLGYYTVDFLSESQNDNFISLNS